MNTKQTKKYVLPLVVVMAVLLAFSSPAVADYSGDHPLTIYEHDTINGGLVYETITDGSGYINLNAIESPTYSQDITIHIPGGATVKMARLYNTYCWSKPDFGMPPDKPGLPAEAELTFNGVNVTCLNPLSESCTGLNPPVECRDALPNPIVYDNGVIHYWDSKNLSKYGGIWDFPSGEFAWDVTDMVTGSGTYTATIKNADSTPTPGERFVTFGFGLLVIYEKPSSPTIEYWVAEGCDILMARIWETPENATTSATFEGSINLDNVKSADLTTVLTCSDGGLWDPPMNMIYFNGVEIGPSTADGICHYGVNLFDVTELLKPDQNVVEFQDRNDCEYVHNAFLVVKKLAMPENVTVTFDQKKLDLNSSGILKAFITLPEGYNVTDINVSTVTCEGATAFGDGSVIPGKKALEVKFKIPDMKGVPTGNAVPITVTGELYDGTPFEGSNTLKVV